MPLAKHLTRREGTYYFRIQVPETLTGPRQKGNFQLPPPPREAKELSYIHSRSICQSFRSMEQHPAHNSPLPAPFSFKETSQDISNHKGVLMENSFLHVAVV